MPGYSVAFLAPNGIVDLVHHCIANGFPRLLVTLELREEKQHDRTATDAHVAVSSRATQESSISAPEIVISLTDFSDNS